MNSKEYLSTLTEQIRCKQAREPIRLEILSHIEEQKQAFQKEGMNPLNWSAKSIEYICSNPFRIPLYKVTFSSLPSWKAVDFTPDQFLGYDWGLLCGLQ